MIKLRNIIRGQQVKSASKIEKEVSLSEIKTRDRAPCIRFLTSPILPPSRILLILLLFSLARFFPFPPFIPRRARILARFPFAFSADFLAAAFTGIWQSFCILSFVGIVVE